MLTVEMLPVEHGDCLWIEYGDPAAPRRILIDGGPTGTTALRERITTRLDAAPGGRLHVELLVVSHIDDDHIAGVLDLLEAPPPGVSFGDVWFNAYKHLVAPDRLGPVQGERLSEVITARRLPWNEAFGGYAVVVSGSGPLPRRILAGGIALTLLSPTMKELGALREVWKEVVREHLEWAGTRREEERPQDLLGRRDTWPPDLHALAAKAPSRDGEPANGSSIALLAEFEGKSVLLAADAFAPVLEASILRLLGEREAERLPIDAFKLPHHGSRNNMTNGLLRLLRCPAYLVSTSGKKFAHPDNEALARVVLHGGHAPQLLFNYTSRWNQGWGQAPPGGAPPYTTRYPPAGSAGLAVTL